MPKLVLKVLHARDLDAKDIGGTSDPFVKIKIGTLQLKTEIIKKNCNPDWNAIFNVDLPPKFDPEFDSIYFDVYDYDRFSSNDLIGKTSFPLNNLEKGKTQQETLNLHNSHKGTLTIELLAEDFGIIIEKDSIKKTQFQSQSSSTVHNRSVSSQIQLNYQQVNFTQPPPPQYFTDSVTPPPQYGQSSPLPPQYSNSNPPPQYTVDKFNSTANQSTQPPQYSTSAQPTQPPQYQNQALPPQYSEQCYPVMQNQNNQSFQGYPPVGYEQQPPPSYRGETTTIRRGTLFHFPNSDCLAISSYKFQRSNKC